MTMAKVAQGHIREWLCPTPSPTEQAVIVDGLSAKISDIEGAENIILSGIDRIREYRQALITAAVTGQLEVAENLAAEAEAVA